MNSESLRVKTKISDLIEALQQVEPYLRPADIRQKLELDGSAFSKLKNGKSKLTPVTISKIIKAFPQVSREWLENDTGEILNTTFNPVQNINGTNAQGTQIIGDGQTTHNNGQSCEDTKEQTSNTGKLLDAHVSLMEQMRQLIEVVKSQQETISHLVVHKK